MVGMWKKKWFALLVASALSAAVPAQPVNEAGQGGLENQPAELDQNDGAEAFRDVAAYPFGAVATTLRSMQFVSYAMLLREYCANEQVSDAFVRERLAWFSELTGREENCGSLLDY